MRIAICDDAKQYRMQILYLLSEYATQNNSINFTFSDFSKAEDLLETAEKIGGFDLYILDVVMSGMNGIELGTKLRERGYDGIIIYLTASTDYAIDSYKTDASNYILKPILKDVFLKAIDKVVYEFTKKKEEGIIVKTKHSNTRITYNNILYVDTCNRALTYHLFNGDIIESTTLRAPFAEVVAPLLQDNRFYQCGKTVLVNLENITEVDTECIIFNNRLTVYFSKNVCRDLRTKWSEYWSN